MGDVEIIREAVALMRERAEAAKESAAYGAWWTSPSDPVPQVTVFAGCGCITDEIAVVREKGESPKLSQHIASWHPPVALAVADLLEHIAAYYECHGPPVAPLPLAIAQAYLGEAAHG